MFGKQIDYKIVAIAGAALLLLGLIWLGLSSMPTAGYIDTSGNLVISLPPDSDGGEFFHGLAPAKSGNNWGYINRTGKWIIPPQFQSASNFSEGVAAVYLKDKRKYAFINQQARGVLELNATTVGDFHEGLAMVVYGDKVGYIDISGKLVIPKDYKFVSSRHSSLGVIPVAQTNPLRWCFVDHKNSPVVPKSFLGAKEVADGLAPVQVKLENKPTPLWGFLGTSGKGYAIEPQFLDVEPFSDDLACVQLDTMKWTYISVSNNKLDVEFDKAYPFSEGFAACGNRDKGDSSGLPRLGYIDKTGKTVINPRFDEAKRFSEGLAFTTRKRWRFFWEGY